MTVLMFWNIGRREISSPIAQLCGEYRVDLLLLAEAEMPSARLTTEVNRSVVRAPLWELPRPVESRIRTFTKYPPEFIRTAFDDGQVKMLELCQPIGQPLLIVAAHLPSKLRYDEDDQEYRVRRLRTDITSQELRSGHRNTVIIGDLNMNPFDDALVAADGLHAVMDKRTAERPPRTVQGRAWDYFYNPMWSRLGDESVGPPGTYWRAGSALVTHFWNTYDQVLLRPGLLRCYDPHRLVVPDRVGDRHILGSDQDPSGLSDHLPIVISLSVELETIDG